MSVKQLSTVTTVSPSDDIWFPVQVNGEWLWKKIAKSSLMEDIRTIVIPSGESFKVVDDATSPTIRLLISNKDADIDSNVKSFSVTWTAGANNSSQLIINQDETDGSGNIILQNSNANGDSFISMNLAANGVASFELSAAKVKLSGIPTYADNAAAIAGGLTSGTEYKTATGERRVVV